jgi:ribosomal protein S18 acetylase RimI-like enzyme
LAFLEVRAGSEARAFYERLGFVAWGARRAYYDAPVEDAVLMRRALGPDRSARRG